MKKIITLLLIALTVPLLQAQEENGEFKTLFGDRHISHGGYGALDIRYSTIDGKDAFLMGGRGAWVIGHGFALGFGGMGFLNDYHYNPDIAGGRNVNLAGGYGGLLLEPILFPKFPVHVSIPVLIGAGGIAYTTSYNPYDWDESHYFVEEATAYFVLEPGIELEFNIVRFFRLAIGGYYRYTSDIRLYDTPENVLHGFSGGITLKFGKF
jgi:hypothetical protein